MNIVVRREAFRFQDDQIGPLEAEFCIEDGATFASFIDEVVASGFLQYSSTHDPLTGETDGRALVEVFGPAGARFRSPELRRRRICRDFRSEAVSVFSRCCSGALLSTEGRMNPALRGLPALDHLSGRIHPALNGGSVTRA